MPEREAGCVPEREAGCGPNPTGLDACAGGARRADPWAILVSEVMLHQTQVPRVAARYDDFLDEFPTPAAMAAAGPGAVITAWGNLGYPRRARRLWEAAAGDHRARLARRASRNCPEWVATPPARSPHKPTTTTLPRSK